MNDSSREIRDVDWGKTMKWFVRFKCFADQEMTNIKLGVCQWCVPPAWQQAGLNQIVVEYSLLQRYHRGVQNVSVQSPANTCCALISHWFSFREKPLTNRRAGSDRE